MNQVKQSYQVPLNVLERYLALVLLPNEGTHGTLRRAKKVREALLFTPMEMDYYGIVYQPENNRTFWNPERKDETKLFQFPAALYEFVGELLGKLDEASKLTPDHLTLFDKFTGGEPDGDGEIVKQEKPKMLDLTPVDPSGSLNHHETLIPAN